MPESGCAHPPNFCAANQEVLPRPGSGSGSQAYRLHTCARVSGRGRIPEALAGAERWAREAARLLIAQPAGFRFLEEIRKARRVTAL